MQRTLWLTKLMARLPLRWRVSLVSFGLLAGTMLLVGTAISTIAESVLLSNQADGLSSQASLLNNSMGGPYKSGQLTQPLTVMDAKQVLEDAQTTVGKETLITLLSNDGQILAQSLDYKGLDTLSETQEQKILKGWQTDQSAYRLVTGTQGQREIVVFSPFLRLIDKERVTYGSAILQLHTSTALVDQSVNSIRLLLLAGMLFGLLIAAALTMPLIRQALRPLSEIEETSLRIARGDLSLRLSEPQTRDELGRLTRSFNSMVAQLETMFERQKRFVADVSHELRTPLTGLGGSLEMLLLEAHDGDTRAARHLMGGMYSEVERMQRLVADLLVLSRLDEGQVVLRKALLDLNVLLLELAEQAEQLAPGQEVKCQLSAEPLLVAADSDQVRRVLLNVLENAIKFTPSGGFITLSGATCFHEDRVFAVLEVCDTGIGISASDLSHIFERFYRVDQSRTRTSAQSGSGLGLSIAKGLIEAHGGMIKIASTPGQGTTVTVLLPMERLNHVENRPILSEKKNILA